MSRVQIAAPKRQRIVPAFTVQKLEGQVERTIISFDKEGKKYDKVVKADAGFLVTFPAKGHSIRVKDVAELKRLGFDQTIPLLDGDSEDDEALGYMPNSVVAA